MDRNSRRITIGKLTAPGGRSSVITRLGSISIRCVLGLMGFRSISFSNGTSNGTVIGDVFGSPSTCTGLSVGSFRFRRNPVKVLRTGMDFGGRLDRVSVGTITSRNRRRRALVSKCMSPGQGCVSLNVRTRNAGVGFVRDFYNDFVSSVRTETGKGIGLINSLDSVGLINSLCTANGVRVGRLNARCDFGGLRTRTVPSSVRLGGSAVFSHGRGVTLMDNNVRRGRLAQLDCSLALGTRGFLNCSARRFNSGAFCNAICTANRINVRNGDNRAVVSVSTRPKPNDVFMCGITDPSTVDSGDFVR